jgi:hypothetical protein
VVIRDCEWIVRRADPSDDGGYVLTVDGLSELVSGKSARFLTRLEEGADAIRVLDPAETRFEQDLTPGFEKSRLFIETQRRQITPADARIHLGHKAAMDPVPYQLDPALQALKQNRQRILIADAVGLGKTLEAGILVTELMRRGRGKRILVLTLKSMMTQFQKELWNRFTIPLTRLDSAGLQRVRNHIPGNHNPFYYYDKTIISIDTLKQDNEYRRHLEQAYWDIIVIDEAHNVAERGTSSQRARLAQLLAGRSDTLIMLSATPHDGKARSFASLMNMLDPTAISDPDDYAREDFRDKGLVIRRFKKDIRDQVQQEFKERVVKDIVPGRLAPGGGRLPGPARRALHPPRRALAWDATASWCASACRRRSSAPRRRRRSRWPSASGSSPAARRAPASPATTSRSRSRPWRACAWRCATWTPRASASTSSCSRC